MQSNVGTAITMGNGNNTLVLQTGSTIIGTANGGGGSNIVTLQGTGTASNPLVNFQTLMMQGAAWNSTGSGTFTTALLQSGTLTLDRHARHLARRVRQFGCSARHGGGQSDVRQRQ